MEVKRISTSQDGLKQKFLVKDSSPAFINALRRAILAYVPTLAIEDIELQKNSSALYDEILAHRLGLIPLTTDLETYELPSECSCKGEGCAKCQVKIKLSKMGPCTIYAEDLKISDPKVKPVYPKMPIVKLLGNQEIAFEAIAQLGRGKQHSKWSPAHVYYQGYPEIEIVDCPNPDEVKAACPKDVFSLSKGELSINKSKLEECDLCKACSNVCEGIKVKGSKKDFLLWIESWGQLPLKEILKAALNYLEGLGKDFEKSL